MSLVGTRGGEGSGICPFFCVMCDLLFRTSLVLSVQEERPTKTKPRKSKVLVNTTNALIFLHNTTIIMDLSDR